MTRETQIAELDRTITEKSKTVELHKALKRLMNTRDFKKVISEGYFCDEAVRLVHLKADKEFEAPDRQANILRQMDSIGNLSGYFDTIRIKGEMAEKEVEDAEIDRRDLVMGGN